MTGKEALAMSANLLTEQEQEEIGRYSRVYYLGTQASKISATDSLKGGKAPTSSGGNARGDYQHCIGEHIGFRYEVLGQLGRGSFGVVLDTMDHKSDTPTALKVIRAQEKFRRQGRIEARILERIREANADGRLALIQLNRAFEFRGHLFFSFPKLGKNLYEVLKSDRFAGMPLGAVRVIGRQLFMALRCLEQLKVIHCDIKPENIMLVEEPKFVNDGEQAEQGAYVSQSGAIVRPHVKLIDFGSACFQGEEHYTYIQSRFYRAPEVILGAGYNQSIDVWSLGCVIGELVAGYPIFPGKNEGDQLARIIAVCGSPPNKLLKRAFRTSVFFHDATDAQAPPTLRNVTDAARAARRRSIPKLFEVHKDDGFNGLVASCLEFDPAKRISPEVALASSFLRSPARSNKVEC